MLTIPVIKFFRDTEQDLKLALVVGKDGLGKKILIPCIQKPSLALAGDVSTLYSGRIQVLGKQELDFFATLSKEKRVEVAKKISAIDVTCFVVTYNSSIPKEIENVCKDVNIPLFKTCLMTSTFINRVT